MSMNDTDKWASQIIDELFDKPKFGNTSDCSGKEDSTSSEYSNEGPEAFFSPLKRNLDRQGSSVVSPDFITGSPINSGNESLISSLTNYNVSEICTNGSALSLNIKEDSKLPVSARFDRKPDECCQNFETSITIDDISYNDHDDIFNCIETNEILQKSEESAKSAVSSSHFNSYEAIYERPCHSNFTKMSLDQNIRVLDNTESKEGSNIPKMSNLKLKDEIFEGIINETDEMLEFSKQSILKNLCLNDNKKINGSNLFMEFYSEDFIQNVIKSEIDWRSDGAVGTSEKRDEDDKEIDSEICSEIHSVSAEENSLQFNGSNSEADSRELSGNIPFRDQQVDKIQRRIKNTEVENSFGSVASNSEDFMCTEYETFADNRFEKEMILFLDMDEKKVKNLCDKDDRELHFEASNRISYFSGQENVPNQQKGKNGTSHSRKDCTMEYAEATSQQLDESTKRTNNNKNQNILENVPHIEEPNEENGENIPSDVEIIERTDDSALKCETQSVLRALDGDKSDTIANENKAILVETKGEDDWYTLLKNVFSTSPKQRKEEIIYDDEIISQRAFKTVILYRAICKSLEDVFLRPFTIFIIEVVEFFIFVFFIFVCTVIYVFERLNAHTSYAFQQLIDTSTNNVLQRVQQVLSCDIVILECNTNVSESQEIDYKGLANIESSLSTFVDEIDTCKEASPLSDFDSFITILPEEVFLNITKNGQVKHSLEDMFEKGEDYTIYLQEAYRIAEVMTYENALVYVVVKDTNDTFYENHSDLPISESLKAGGCEKHGSKVNDSCQLCIFSKIIEELPSEEVTWKISPKSSSQDYGSWPDFKDYLSDISGVEENNILNSTEIDCSRLERGDRASTWKSDRHYTLGYVSCLDSNISGAVAAMYTSSLDAVTTDSDTDKKFSMDVNLSCSSGSELDLTLNTIPLLDASGYRLSESRLRMRPANSNELSVIFDKFHLKQSTSLDLSLVNFVPANSHLATKSRSLDDEEKHEQLWMRPANDAELAKLFEKVHEKRSKSLILPLTRRLSEVPFSKDRNKSDNAEVLIDFSNKEVEENSVIQAEESLHVSAVDKTEYSNEFSLTVSNITDVGQENAGGSPDNSVLDPNSRYGSQIFHVEKTSIDETNIVVVCEDDKKLSEKRSSGKLRRRMSLMMSNWKSLHVMDCVIAKHRSRKKYKKHCNDAEM